MSIEELEQDLATVREYSKLAGRYGYGHSSCSAFEETIKTKLTTAKAEAEEPGPEDYPKELWGTWSVANRRWDYFGEGIVAHKTKNDALDRMHDSVKNLWVVHKLFPRPTLPDETTTRLVAAVKRALRPHTLMQAHERTRDLESALADYLAAHPTEDKNTEENAS